MEWNEMEWNGRCVLRNAFVANSFDVKVMLFAGGAIAQMLCG